MKNLFQIYYDKTAKQSIAEYDKYVIRRVSKKQETKLKTIGQNYKASEKNRGLPKWLNLMNRISFSATFTSFIFLIVSLLINASEKKENFVMEYLWLIIVFSISIIVFLCSIGIAFFYKKRKKVLKTEETSQNLFNTILETSKQFLSVPASARSLEVLMEQIKDSSSNKMKKYTNILLSVFVENDMLCFADLYVVIGIPIKNIKEFEIVQEPYRFEYWHKGKDKSNLEEYGVKRITKPIRYYQANHYAVLKMNFSNKDLGVFIPAYELEEYQTTLKEKRDNE